MKSSVYVTGATGFIGAHTAGTCASSGYQVIGIDQVPPRGNGRGSYGIAQFVESPCTLGALEETAKRHGVPIAVVHCAGSASVPVSFQDPRADFLANVSTMLDVLEFARRHETVRVVVPSSVAVYGAVSDIPLREGALPRPVSPYGVHKYLSEQLCRSYAANFGVPVVCIRLFSVYGAGLRKQLLWDACNKATSGKFQFFGTGDELRDWLHVSDAARLLRMAVDWASPECPIMNGGTGTGTSIRDILTHLGSLWEPLLFPDFSGQERRGDPFHYVADVERISRLGFRPEVNMHEALAEYVAWFRKERGL